MDMNHKHSLRSVNGIIMFNQNRFGKQKQNQLGTPSFGMTSVCLIVIHELLSQL